MELVSLTRTSAVSTAMELLVLSWRSLLLVSGVLFVGRSLAASSSECDDIARERGMAAVQAFLPSKIQIHKQCKALRENRTEICSKECNLAIEQFLTNNGGEEGRIFFSCVCTNGSAIYPPKECAVDRDRLLLCPALAFLLPVEGTLTTTERSSEEVASNSSTTKTAPSITPIVPLGRDCRSARLDCQFGLGCAQAFDHVKDMCLDDLTQHDKCSGDCKRAVGYIDRYSSSNALWGCACDPESEEASWCGMYGREGLRKSCGGKYKEIVDQTSARNEEQKSDPENSGSRHAMASITAFIPILTILLL